ncbi:MAG TPA: Rho-binding antiterminator [Gammaproteobacteria bacterium]|nr:Rho-binding antiterminator [Gammaproteobacteria bacterium]
MEPTDYTPIDCGLYSEYEVVIMHHERLRLSWRDARGDVHIGIVTPIDLRTRNGAEFLVVREQDGETRSIRLDRIVQFARA